MKFSISSAGKVRRCVGKFFVVDGIMIGEEVEVEIVEIFSSIGSLEAFFESRNFLKS